MSTQNIIKTTTVTILVCIIFFGSSTNALSWPFKKRGHYKNAKILPAGHVRIVVGKNNYYYHHGIFYKKHRGDFVVVAPPIGALVPVLPVGHTTIVIGGAKYYYYDDVYYKLSGSGYIVTPAEEIENVKIQTNEDDKKTKITEVESSEESKLFTINIPNDDGSFTPVLLKRTGDGYVGPQGEFYIGKPTIDQLKVLYGK